MDDAEERLYRLKQSAASAAAAGARAHELACKSGTTLPDSGHAIFVIEDGVVKVQMHLGSGSGTCIRASLAQAAGVRAWLNKWLPGDA